MRVVVSRTRIVGAVTVRDEIEFDSGIDVDSMDFADGFLEKTTDLVFKSREVVTEHADMGTVVSP
jgi:hypothetical protein